MAVRKRRKPKGEAPKPPDNGAGVKDKQLPTVPKNALSSKEAAGRLYGAFPKGGVSANPTSQVRPTK